MSDLTALEAQVWHEIEYFDNLGYRVPAAQLALRCGTSERQVRKAVHGLRVKGHPVGSCTAAGYYGYFVSATAEDIADTHRQLVGRIRQQAAALRQFDAATAQAVLEALGQERLGGSNATACTRRYR